MPKIPQYQAAQVRDSASPAQVGRAPDTGASAVGAAFSSLGNQLQRTAQMFHEAEVRSGTTIAETKMQEKFGLLRQEIEQMSDYEQVRDHYERGAAGILKSLSGEYKKNPAVQRNISEMFNRANAQEKVRTEQIRRHLYVDKTRAEYSTIISLAEKDGDRAKISQVLDEGIQAGIYSHQEAAKIREQTGFNLDYWDVHRQIQADPEAVIDWKEHKHLDERAKDNLTKIQQGTQRQAEADRIRLENETLRSRQQQVETWIHEGEDLEFIRNEIYAWEKNEGLPMSRHESTRLNKGIDEVQHQRMSALEQKETAVTKSRIESYTEAWRANLNSIQVEMAIGNYTPKQLAEWSDYLYENIADIPQELFSRTIGQIREMQGNLEQGIKQQRDSLGDAQSIAARHIKDLDRFNFFSRHTVDKKAGTIITEKERRLELEKDLKKADSRWFGDKQEARKEALQKFYDQEQTRNRIHDNFQRTVFNQIEERAAKGEQLTEEDIKDIIRKNIPESMMLQEIP